MDKFGSGGAAEAPAAAATHLDQAFILNKEVIRHVRGSAQSQLEVQQIDTFDSGDTFRSSGGGYGQEH